MGHTCSCCPFSTSHPGPQSDSRCTPVSIMMQKFPDIFVFSDRSKTCPELTCFHVTFHGRVHGLQQSKISTHLILCPRCQNTGITPVIHCHRNHDFPLSRNNYQRNRHRNSSAFILLASHILKPLFKETAHIEVISCSWRKQCNISCPSHSLISLWTVRWNINKVGLCPPTDTALQLIHQLVRTGEFSVVFYVGIQCNGTQLHILLIRAFHAHIAKSHVSHSR